MPAGQNAVPGKQGFQATGKPGADLAELEEPAEETVPFDQLLPGFRPWTGAWVAIRRRDELGEWSDEGKVAPSPPGAPDGTVTVRVDGDGPLETVPLSDLEPFTLREMDSNHVPGTDDGWTCTECGLRISDYPHTGSAVVHSLQ